MKNDIIIFLAKYLVFIIALSGLIYWFKLNKDKKVRLAAAIIIGALVALILAKLAGSLYYHPRPFVTAHIKPLVAHPADNGFPSEHMSLAMVITTVLYFYRPKLAAGLLVLSVLVGLGRIWAHVHSPIDILAGLALGVIAGLVGYFLSGYIIKDQPAKERP